MPDQVRKRFGYGQLWPLRPECSQNRPGSYMPYSTSRNHFSSVFPMKAPIILRKTDQGPIWMAWSESGQTHLVWSESGQTHLVWSESGQTHLAWSESGQTHLAWSESGQTHLAWSESGQTHLVWSESGQTHLAWSESGQTHLVWSESGQTHLVWSESGQTHLVWSESGQTHLVWSESGQTHLAWSEFGQTHLVWEQAGVQESPGPVSGRTQPAHYQFPTFRLGFVLPQTSRILLCKTSPGPIQFLLIVSGLGQTCPVRKQADVQNSPGSLLANACQPILTECGSDPACLLGGFTHVYWVALHSALYI